MGNLVLSKTPQKLSFQPFDEHPNVIFFYKRMTEKKWNELRDVYGENSLNKRTKAYEFKIVDEEGFKKACLLEILIGWEGVSDENGREIPFSEIEEYVMSIPQWLLNALTLRALGLAEEAELENMLTKQKVEAAAKNF